jgi:hypothetical protein
MRLKGSVQRQFWPPRLDRGKQHWLTLRLPVPINAPTASLDRIEGLHLLHSAVPIRGLAGVDRAPSSGGVSRVAKGADCKSAAVWLRRFESSLPHQQFQVFTPDSEAPRFEPAILCPPGVRHLRATSDKNPQAVVVHTKITPFRGAGVRAAGIGAFVQPSRSYSFNELGRRGRRQCLTRRQAIHSSIRVRIMEMIEGQ